MPINKFTTLLDLARQAKIITGETATFDGKIQAGIPFSGYPTGVDTGTTVSLGVVSSEDAVFSGNSGTTIFDVANTGSTNYSPIFSGYSGSVWTNVLFSGNTSGLTLPITPLSADTQVVGPFWTLTQTGMTGDYVIGTQYTGYSVTYSFFNVSQFGTGFTYSGFTTATQENFSAGTLDYKGPLDYISTKEDASVEGRLTTNKLTVTGGASSATTGYVLTQTGDTGEVGWVFNSASGTTDTNLANSNLIQSAATRTYTLPAGYRLQFKDNSNFNMLELGEAAGQVTVNGSSQDIDFVAVGLTDSNLLRTDATNDRVGIGTLTPTEKLHVEGGDILVSDTNGIVFTDIQNSAGTTLRMSAATDTQITRFMISEDGGSGMFLGQRGFSEVSFPSGNSLGKQGDGFLYSGNDQNGLNIISQPGTGTDDYIRFFVGQSAGAAGTPDLYIQGSGTTRGNVGINTDTPTEKLHIEGGDILINNTYGTIFSELDVLAPSDTNLTLSGISTQLTEFRVLSPNSGGIAMGIRGETAGFPNYGKVKDGYIYSSVLNNGINIISQRTNPQTTDDYIRFYAGEGSGSGTTAQLHIQGSGTTRGNIGINNESPTSKLDISGTTGYQQLRLRTSYTPSSTADANGEIGDISWDNSYLYIKTGTGWGRVQLDFAF